MKGKLIWEKGNGEKERGMEGNGKRKEEIKEKRGGPWKNEGKRKKGRGQIRNRVEKVGTGKEGMCGFWKMKKGTVKMKIRNKKKEENGMKGDAEEESRKEG
jgi:hypothetical protein